MGKRSFSTSKEAFDFAKGIAIETQSVVKTFRLNNKWIVEGEQVCDEAYYFDLIENLRNELENNEKLQELLNLITENSKIFEFRKIKNITLPEAVMIFLDELPNVRDKIYMLSLYDKDVRKVNTKEYALDMAYEFNQIAEDLNTYKISNLARRHKVAMIQLSLTLKPELDVSKEIKNSKIISQLEAAKGKCTRPTCEGKLVIRESSRGYFWGCNLFPKCFSRKNLNSQEAALLD